MDEDGYSKMEIMKMLHTVTVGMMLLGTST